MINSYKPPKPLNKLLPDPLLDSTPLPPPTTPPPTTPGPPTEPPGSPGGPGDPGAPGPPGTSPPSTTPPGGEIPPTTTPPGGTPVVEQLTRAEKAEFDMIIDLDKLNKEINAEEDQSRMPFVKSREMWQARRPDGWITKIDQPASKVLLTFVPTFKPCRGSFDCLRTVHRLQFSYMETGALDIPFNFMVDGKGKIYEGRGWLKDPMVPPRRADLPLHKTVVIATLGEPSDAYFQKNKELVRKGIGTIITFGLRSGFLHCKFKLEEVRPWLRAIECLPGRYTK